MNSQIAEVTVADTIAFNKNISYLDVAALLTTEPKVDKFKAIVAGTTLANITTAISQALESELNFKPQLEVIESHSKKIIFREDYNYFLMLSDKEEPRAINPFAELELLAELSYSSVYCSETGLDVITKEEFMRVRLSLDYDYMPNPKFYEMIADYLNVALNEDQEWVKEHNTNFPHPLQKYLELSKVVNNRCPHLTPQYHSLLQEVSTVRSFSLINLQAKRQINYEYLSPDRALEIYELKDKRYEDSAFQSFWDLPEMKEVLRELTVAMGSVITNFFPAVRNVAETSLHRSKGYDVYFANSLGNRLVVKSLGDYRILMWELSCLKQ